MAHHKSALKRNRQNVVRRARNRAVRTRVRAALKEARIGIAEGASDAADLVKQATRLLDRAASKNVFHLKHVARIKSRLAAYLKRASAAPSA